MIWAILLVRNIYMTVTAMFFAPILPLFALGKDHLPGWLSDFDTPDNPIYGDSGFRIDHPNDTYWTRVLWLWRNPAYGFDVNVLGRRVYTWPVIVSGDPWIGNMAAASIGRKTGQSGYCRVKGDGCWEWYYVRQWGNTSKCVRIRLGWKLLGFAQRADGYPIGGLAQFCFSPNPWMHFDN